MHNPSSLLFALAIALSLAGTAMTLVMYQRDGTYRQPGLTLRQRVIVRYRRHPRMLPAVLACAVTALALLIAYNMTL